MPDTLIFPLQFLVYVMIVMIVILGVFCIKLIFDLTLTVNSLKSILNVIQHETAPLTNELKLTLNNINLIAKQTEKQVSNASNSLNKINIQTQSLKHGLSTGIKTFLGKGS